MEYTGKHWRSHVSSPSRFGPGAHQAAGFIPDSRDLTCLSPSSQELVREMVDADVELMRSNPNA